MTGMHEWFTHARFGMVIHFGLYSMLGRGEWVMTNERIPPQKYAAYADIFDPDRFDARALARAAKDAGMGYAVMTAKHHDGFALFDTQFSPFNSMRACGRDLVREFVDAFRAEGLRVGLYFSLIDWQHSDFTIDYHHPLRNHPYARDLNQARDMERYRTFMHAQVRELLTQYGRLDYVFYDFSYVEDRDGWQGKGPQDWDSIALLAMTRQLQPDAIVNDRLWITGDVITPEQYQPDAPMTRENVPVMWEACQTLDGSWGYNRDNHRYKSHDLLIRMLVDTVSKNGNVLLNIGPDGRGAITPQDQQALDAISTWMDLHGQSVVGAGATSYAAPNGTVLTRRGDRLYLHVLVWPFGHLHLPGLADKVRHARLLNDGSQIIITRTDPDQVGWNTEPAGQPAGTLTLNVPTTAPDVAVPVIELFLTPDA